MQKETDIRSFGYTNDLSGLYDKVTKLIRDYLHQYEDRNSKVVEFHTPTELRNLVDLTLPDNGVQEDKIIDLCKQTLQYSVHVGESLITTFMQFSADLLPAFQIKLFFTSFTFNLVLSMQWLKLYT